MDTPPTYIVSLTLYRANLKALTAHAQALGGSLTENSGRVSEFTFPTKRGAQTFCSHARLADARHVTFVNAGAE